MKFHGVQSSTQLVVALPAETRRTIVVVSSCVQAAWFQGSICIQGVSGTSPLHTLIIVWGAAGGLPDLGADAGDLQRDAA
jgi:hypothetical protein